MKKRAIEETVEKAEAFLLAARELIGNDYDMRASERGSGTVRSSALRRASMDLTRSLAVMRTWNGKRCNRWEGE